MKQLDLNLETIWQEYSRRLEAFIRERISDPEDTQDLLQEVFVRLHMNLCCLRDLSRMESWLFQVARHAIIDYYRRRRQMVELTEDVAFEPEDTLEVDAATELALSLRHLAQELPEPYREALLLTDYCGISQKEAAERLGVTLPNLKSRVQRARQKMRDMLLTCCHFEFDRYGRVVEYHQHCCCCTPSTA